MWTGGTMSGTGSTIAEGTLQLGAANTSGHDEVLSQRSFSNAGSANWLGNIGEFDQQNGSTFTNQANASFTIQNNLVWYNDENNSTFVNLGTFTKSAGTGTTIFEVGFNNNGSVEVQTGTLSLRGGGTSSGSFTADASATLGFDASYTNTPPFVLSATSTISGAGTAEFGSGTVNDSGTLNMAGGITVDGGTANFTSPVTSAGAALVISVGTLNFSGGQPISIGTLSQSGGTLAGSDSVTVTGALMWTGGTMSGTGSTIAEGYAASTGAANTSGHDEVLGQRESQQCRQCQLAG